MTSQSHQHHLEAADSFVDNNNSLAKAYIDRERRFAYMTMAMVCCCCCPCVLIWACVDYASFKRAIDAMLMNEGGGR